MHSTIEKNGFMKGNSQEIIKKLTDKKLKEVAPNIWELNIPHIIVRRLLETWIRARCI